MPGRRSAQLPGSFRPGDSHAAADRREDHVLSALDVEALFRAHGEELFRYLLRFTGGDEATARDAVQDAFTKCLERPPSDDNPRAWLYRVAMNAVRDWGNRDRRQEELMAEHAGKAPAPDPGPPPDEAVERRSDIGRVKKALAELPEKERTILLMREEGFKHREIAEAVGTTTGSVGTMVARALDRLARVLDPLEEAAG